MLTHLIKSRDRCRRGLVGVGFLALLVIMPIDWAVAAEDGQPWRFQPTLDFRTATYFEFSGSTSMAYPAVGAELSIELSPLRRPYSMGLFADYELSTEAESKHTRLVGSWLSYRYGRWKLSTVAAQFGSDQVSGLWMYASKLQFEPRPGHKLAIEAIGALQGNEAPGFQLAYETYLTRHMSISISLGMGSNRMRDVGASTKFVWNLY